MADANRRTVNALVLHHAVTPLWSEKSKKELAQWFSDNGFKRAYGSNTAKWSGLYNPYTGAKSYAQAHYAGQRVTSATPDATATEKAAGYRLVPLVKDVWGQITWGAGDWEMNRRCINIENLGDYRNYTLRDGDCRVIADFWRPQDKKLKGATYVLGHNEIYATACPARIIEKRNTIVNYVNNPPATVTTKTIKVETPIPFKKSEIKDPSKLEGVTSITQPGVNGIKVTTYKVTFTNGRETSRKAVSSEITKQPVGEVTLVGTKTIAQETLETVKENNNLLKQILELIKNLVAKIGGIFK